MDSMIICLEIKRLHRTPIKALCYLIIITLICGFLSIGINLWQTARDNNALMIEEYSTAAFATFQGNVDHRGELTLDPSGSYRKVFAKDFNESVFETANGIKDVLIHRQFGGYIENQQHLTSLTKIVYEPYDIIIFTYMEKQPQIVKWFAGTNETKISSIRLDWSASGMEEIPFMETQKYGNSWSGFRFYNQIDSGAFRTWEGMLPDDLWLKDEANKPTMEICLEPGKQYIATGQWSVAMRVRNDVAVAGTETLNCFSFSQDQAHAVKQQSYGMGDWMMASDSDAYSVSYPCIMPYTEDFWETDAGKYYQDAIEVTAVNARSVTMVATPDLSLYRPFYEEGVYISDGRGFEPADYESVNKVCLVSKYLADLNGWQIGDVLDLSFYPSNYSYSRKASDVQSFYEPLRERIHEETGETELYVEDIFFDEGRFEIVGFYDGNVTKSEYLDDTQYSKKEGIDRRVVIVPEKSVQNLPEVPLSQYNTTILLDDEQILYFMADMEASGLLEQQLGQYQVSFEIYDQGLGQIKQSLRQLDAVSKLTLYLACAAAVAVVILLSVLTVIQNRRQIATLRSLGVRKHQIPTAVLSGVLLVCLLGSCLGGYIGYKASDKVATYILETAQQDMADTSFSAMLAGDTEAKEEAYTIAIQSRPQAAIIAAAAVMLSLTALSCTLALIEARKSPMLTLGAKE